jgi:hypothetical protein
LGFQGCWVTAGEVLELDILTLLFDFVGRSFFVFFVYVLGVMLWGWYVVLVLDCVTFLSLPWWLMGSVLRLERR